ncbi:MAG: ZIP family metal transporter [Christensenellaceae bacterium]|nr:ZIP family metal transporter [Christensenellaceae bacterium]
MKKIFILFLAVMLLLSMPMQAFAHIHTHLGEHEEETSEDCPAEQGMGGFGAFLLTFVSGMVTVIGAASVLLFKKSSKRVLAFFLGFSGGTMLGLAFLELIPESVAGFGIGYMLLFFIAGIGVYLLVEKCLPHSHGHEDCHEHHAHYGHMEHIGLISAAALLLHNIPEGIATFAAGQGSYSMGMKLAIAIALHNIPVGISIAMPLMYSGRRGRAIFIALIAALAEPLGALIAWLFLGENISEVLLSTVFAIAAGLLSAAALDELLPESRRLGFDTAAFLGVMLGICLMPAVGLF